MPACLPPTPPPCRPSAPAVSCAATQQDVDLKGGDIPKGTVSNAADIGVCCDACKARPDCGAFTYVPWGQVCYLKSSTGFEVGTTAGMQSVLISGREPAVVIVDPNPPTDTPTPAVPDAPNGAEGGDPYAVGPYSFVEMTTDQQRRMYQLTSIFENSNVSLGLCVWFSEMEVAQRLRRVS